MSDNPSAARSFSWVGFAFTGGTAFCVDAAITTGLIHFARLDPFSSRLIANFVAMVTAWLLHRRLTFDVAGPPTVKEFARFFAVAWSANALNYAIYVLILLVRPATWPLAALVASTAVATIFSYLGFRFGVFRQPPPVA